MFESQLRNMPVALTIAGSDSGGGAGIQADLKTFASLSVFGTSAITCTTAQNPKGVISVQALEVEHIKDQIRQVLDYFDVRAIKTGMLFSQHIIESVASLLKDHQDIPLILDPVMVSTSGARLLEEDAKESLTKQLFPLASLITPNLDEAEVLTGNQITDLQSMVGAARTLAVRHQTAVLLKGGHLEGNIMTDILAFPESDFLKLSSPRIKDINSHGSGCTLASAIAAEVAKGRIIRVAVEKAHRYLQRSFRNPVQINKMQFLNHFV